MVCIPQTKIFQGGLSNEWTLKLSCNCYVNIVIHFACGCSVVKVRATVDKSVEIKIQGNASILFLPYFDVSF